MRLKTLRGLSGCWFSLKNEFEWIRTDIAHSLDRIGIKEATPIQRKVFPEFQPHRDMIILSQTGTGKSLSYHLPTINSMMKQKQRDSLIKGILPRGALIITSNRELVAQLYLDIRDIDNLGVLKVTRISSIGSEAIKTLHMVL